MVLYAGYHGEGALHTEVVGNMLTSTHQLGGGHPKNHHSWIHHKPERDEDEHHSLLCLHERQADEEMKEEFYNLLQVAVSKQGANNITVLMGDVNANMGADNRGYEQVMGRHGLGTMNENGELFADFCALNSLVIKDSVFPHRRIHKATWRSPDHVTENHIDHVCLGQSCRRSLHDVRVKRGANVASDHRMVLATPTRKRDANVASDLSYGAGHTGPTPEAIHTNHHHHLCKVQRGPIGG